MRSESLEGECLHWQVQVSQVMLTHRNLLGMQLFRFPLRPAESETQGGAHGVMLMRMKGSPTPTPHTLVVRLLPVSHRTNGF